MLTVEDIKNLKAFFTSKQDLNKFEDRFNRRFDDVMTKMDSVYKEVRDMRQEQVVHLRAAHDRIQDEIDSGKKRLDKVESVLNL